MNALITARHYVGSVPGFDAWERIPRSVVGNVERVTGVYKGSREHVAIIRDQFRSVRQILRQAEFLANIANQECVLTTFDVSEFPDVIPAFAKEWRAETVPVSQFGNELVNSQRVFTSYTIGNDGSAYAFRPVDYGSFFAILVDKNGRKESV